MTSLSNSMPTNSGVIQLPITSCSRPLERMDPGEDDDPDVHDYPLSLRR